MRVLLMTHDPVLARAYQAHLTRSGFEVAHAPTGYEGLAKARQWIPELMLLDLTMPGLHGLDILKLLRDLPQLVQVPVIALVEHTLAQETIDQCALWGADGFLHKDRCSVDDLVDHMRAVLQQRAAPHPASTA